MMFFRALFSVLKKPTEDNDILCHHQHRVFPLSALSFWEMCVPTAVNQAIAEPKKTTAIFCSMVRLNLGVNLY